MLDNFLKIIQKYQLEILHLNVINKKFNFYLNQKNFNEIEKIVRKNPEYKIQENITLVQIDFSQKNLLNKLNNLIKILNEKEIPFLEIGVMENKIYLILKNQYKNIFIMSFDKLTKELK
ncbi:MAG: hypothetical protein ACOCQA_03615 [bacterium]